MVRTQIYLTDRQKTELDIISKTLGKKQSELIREAVDRLIDQTGRIRRDYAKSHGVGLADSIIAATCKSENTALKTLNAKHYPMMKGLKPAYKK